MQAKALYGVIKISATNPMTIRQALEVIEQEITDPRAYLIREFGYSFEDAAQIDKQDVGAAIIDELLKRYDPRFSYKEALENLCKATGGDEIDVISVAVPFFEAFYLALNNVHSEFNQRMIVETGRFAGYVYESALELKSLYLRPTVRETAQALSMNLTPDEIQAWWVLLHLDLEGSLEPRSVQIADWLFSVFA
jgi:hypothetical protein